MMIWSAWRLSASRLTVDEKPLFRETADTIAGEDDNYGEAQLSITDGWASFIGYGPLD